MKNKLIVKKGTRVFEKKIKKCYHECPYFKLDGGPSSIMVCGHPSLSEGSYDEVCIISHPDCMSGFPEKCPLKKLNSFGENK